MKDTKKKYLEYLHDSKIIPQDEYESTSFDILFRKYFHTDLTINFVELAGLQYYNYAIEKLQMKNYIGALKSIEKLEILFKIDINKMQKNLILENLLLLEKQQRKYNSSFLAKIVNSNCEDSTIVDFANNYFGGISHELTINHPDIELYDNYYNSLIQLINDTINVDIIKQDFYTYSGIYFNYQGDYNQSLSRLEKAYKINPKSLKIKSLLIEAIYFNILKEKKLEVLIDTIYQYYIKYPFIKDDVKIQTFTLYTFVRLINPLFEFNENEQGLKYFKSFENFISMYPEVLVNDEMIGSIYGQVSAYNVRKQRYQAAKEILKRGLKIAPNAEELKGRLKTIENYEKQ